MSNSIVPSSELLRALLVRAREEKMDVSVTEKLEVLLHYAEHACSIGETCRVFGISRSTFHRWVAKFDPQDLRTFVDKSHEPLTRRQPTIHPATVERIRQYRLQDPQIGKERIAALLHEQNIRVSASSVGRVIERECLYFGDTPLHWRKRASGGKDSAASASETAQPISVTREHAALSDVGSEEARVQTWMQWGILRRLIVISSIITNVAFVGMLIAAAFAEHVREGQRIEQHLDTENQQILHAAPADAYIP